MSAEDEEAKMATEEFVAGYNDEHKIQPYSGTPKKDGVASAGDASTGFACGDHVHPTDTSRMAASATGADIAVSGSDPTKISVALAGKADSATTYTKDEVDEIVASVKNGSRQIVASLNDVTDPKPLVIYMVAKQSAQTKNAYDEYIWTAAGAWEKIGDTEIDLSGYVPKETGKGLSTNDYTTEEKTKLEGIEAGAQVNVIETVKVNGTALTPQDKAVNIPVPAPSTATPAPDGTGSPGSASFGFSCGNHVHPTDTSRMAADATGADIPVDATVGAQKINAALAGKASKADATLTEKWTPTFALTDAQKAAFSQTPGASDNDYALTIVPSSITAHYTLYVGSYNAASFRKEQSNSTNLVFESGDARLGLQEDDIVATLSGYQLGSQDDRPLASEAEAEALRTAVANKPIILDVAKHSRITVDGAELQVVLYWNSTRDRFFMTAQRVGTWLTQSGEWQSSAEAYTHTWKSGGVTYTATRAAGGWTTSVYINGVESPIDNIASRCAGKDLGTTAYAFYDTLNAYFATYDRDGNLISATYVKKGNIPYDRITITTGQLQDHAVQKVKLNAATTTLTLPALTDLTGKVSDFGIDVVNAYAPKVGGTPTPTAASFQLDGTLGTDYNLIVPDGETWSDMTALAPNEMAVYYFTLSAFQINDKLTWEVMKKVVKLVPVPPAP